MPLPLAALLPIVASLAPGLIKHFAGDTAGAIAQQVGSAVVAVTGSQDPEAVQLAIQDPAKATELRIALARIESDAETERLRLLLADVQSARAQTVALAQAGSPIAWGAVVISAIVVLGFFGLAAVMLLVPAPSDETMKSILNNLAGAMIASFAAVVAFWVGSSNSSARKDEMLRTALGNGAGAGASR